MQLGDKIGVRLPRLPVLRLRGALPFDQVGVDLFPVPKVKRQGAIHLLQRQVRLALDDALRRHPVAEEIDHGIKGYMGVSHPINAFDPCNVLPLNKSVSNSIVTRGSRLAQALELLNRPGDVSARALAGIWGDADTL